MRDNYIGYVAFGGGDRFMNAYANLIRKVNNETRTISNTQYCSWMRGELGFVKDDHFSIGWFNGDENIIVHPKPRMKLFWNTEQYFYPAEGSIWLLKTEDGLAIVQDTNNDMKNNLSIMPTITETGAIAWISCVQATVKPEPRVIQAELHGKYIDIAIDYNELQYELKSDSLLASVTLTTRGIAVVNIPRMLNPADEKVRCPLEASTDAVKEKPIVIIDISKNVGGYSDYGQVWGFRYWNEQVPDLYIWGCSGTQDISDLKNLIKELNLKLNTNMVRLANDINEYKYPLVQDSRLHFVCVSQFTASAAEGFLSILTSTQRTLILGTVSNGAVNFNAVKHEFGKNDEIYLRFVTHRYYLLNEIPELDGFTPEFIVDPDRAPELIDKFVSYYGMETIQSVFDELYRIKTPNLHNLMVE